MIVASILKALARIELRGPAIRIEIPMEWAIKSINVEKVSLEKGRLIIEGRHTSKETRIEPIEDASCPCR
jgi:hypothetical protein